jgi:hypothetical protein
MTDNSHVSQSWQKSPETYVQLKEARDCAAAKGEHVFVFRGRLVLVDYANHLLEYLKNELGIQEA